MTDFDDIERMLDLMDARGLEEFELEREGLRVRFRKPGSPAAPVPAPTAPPGPGSAPPSAEADAAAAGVTVIKSPIVGTFYRGAEPGADPFVEVGATVRRGQVVCIIEAMKLMNEIGAEVGGVIVKRFVSNAQPVEYGEKLFAVKPGA